MNSFDLQAAALILMVSGHGTEFLPGMTVWMCWLGRLGVPIFKGFWNK